MPALAWKEPKKWRKIYYYTCFGPDMNTRAPPTKLKAAQITPNPNPNLNNKGNTRRNPYPPNFSKTPAKIIEPETGAST
jgi:hypothetical protein